MNEKPFVHLHVHSEYSLLDGAIRCSELLETTAAMGMPAVALTDHGVMYGCEEFYEKAQQYGVKPILGCEVYVDPAGHETRDSKGRNNHLVLLAETDEGYHNLIKLVSIAHTDGFYYKPRVDHGLLSKYSRGLIASSACLAGEIPSMIVDNTEGVLDRAHMYQDIFGKGNFYLEVMHNSLTPQAVVNKELVSMSRSYGFPLVATNDAHYMRREDSTWHDVLLCVQTGVTVDTPGRYRFGCDDTYFRSREEMWDIFGAEIPDALTNTLAIAERCNVTLTLGKYFLPEFPIPSGTTLEAYLEEMSWHGLERRLGAGNINEEYAERLKFELGVINQMGFAGYFCIVSDIIVDAKSRGIPVGPGRGSAAGSLVAWALGITELDPIQYHLLFERFLNPERISMPDIDTDVSDKRRDEVLAYIVDKYGADRVAQIITFDRMKSKAAIRDVGRALDVPLPDVDRVAKLIPEGVKTIGEALEKSPDLKEESKKDAKIKYLLDTASHIEGIARHCSQHAAGVVITPLPMTDMVPVRRIGDNQIATQYSMEPIEHLGLVKMDFLGLRTLSVLDEALSNIAANGGEPVNLSAIPMDDPKTFEMLQRADTLGVFQLESSGMRDLLRRLHPDSFEDIIAVLALYRPGPLNSGMVDDYIARKHGRAITEYPHPKLENSLKPTYGVILYQEQVMQCASELAGFTLGEADLLRRAMGKKKADVMELQRSKFVEGAIAREVSKSKAEEIFDNIQKFAEYGFNKSHSAAYALISYQTAWLKANYGAEFLASYLSSMIGSKTDVLGSYIREVRDQGYPVLPPDINVSRMDFTVDGDVIRFGLSAVSRVGVGAVENILAVRESGGPFSSLWDFLCRVDLRSVNKGVMENLIKSGAFDCCCENRSQLLGNLVQLQELAQKRAALASQKSLFCDDDQMDEEIPPMEECQNFSVMDKLAMEKEVLGLYISGHPFEEMGKRTASYITCPLGDAAYWCSPDIKPVFCGLLSSFKEKYTKRGDPMGILEFEDTTSKLEAVCFPKSWLNVKPVLEVGKSYIFSGNVKNDMRISVLIDDIHAVDGNMTRQRWVRLHVDMSSGVDDDFFLRLSRELKGHPGKDDVLISLEKDDTSVLLYPKGCKVCGGGELEGILAEMFSGQVKVL